VSVNYSTLSGTATAGTDFTSASGTLRWADGESARKPITINIADDTTDESDEIFTVTLSNPSPATTLGNSSLPVTIVDDDAPSGGDASTLGFAATAAGVSERGSIDLAVVRSGSSVGAVSVDYSTASGGALAGTDFTSASGSLSWVDGDSSNKTITINIADDTTDESDETFTVTLSKPSPGAGLGTNSTATVTIADDDVLAQAPKNSGGGSSDGLVLALLLVSLARRLAFVRLISITDKGDPGPRSSGGRMVFVRCSPRGAALARLSPAKAALCGGVQWRLSMRSRRI